MSDTFEAIFKSWCNMCMKMSISGTTPIADAEHASCYAWASRCNTCNDIRFDHEMFCKHSRLRGHGKLRRVLLAYGRYDREVQYCQVCDYSYTYLISFDENAQCLSLAHLCHHICIAVCILLYSTPCYLCN
jgi:Rab-GTPase-TBC domain